MVGYGSGLRIMATSRTHKLEFELENSRTDL